MGDLRAEDSFTQSLNSLLRPLLEGDEGKAATTARHLVSHDRDINDFTKALKVSLNVRLFGRVEDTTYKELYELWFP